jgi:prepilin-type N-terminal cleavage/methylation domain-containing protein
VQKQSGFTLLEICIAVFIAALLVTLAVPSVSGVLAEQRMKRSFESFDALTRDAQTRSRTERRAFVLAWDKDGIALRPEQPAAPEEEKGVSRIDCAEKETFDLNLPAALIRNPSKEWIFWPTGTCEPATVIYHGPTGEWTASYNPLTARADFSTP